MELKNIEQMETNNKIQLLSDQEESKFMGSVKERLESNKDDDGYVYKDFLHGWNLYKKGCISRHDLYCQLVDVFSCNNQDFLDELKKFLIYSSACPLSQ